MDKRNIKGHLSAFVTCVIWGTTFVSTKVLLPDFSPVEILFVRFLLGLLGLWILRPSGLHVEKKQEGILALAGLTGVCLFYLTENVALLYTSASNVSVLVSLAPFVTAFLVSIFSKEETLHVRFFIGCGIALAGAAILCFMGEDGVRVNLKGDLLALSAAVFWALYAVISKKISTFGYDDIKVTRRIFEYGILFMTPALLFEGIAWDVKRLCQLNIMVNMLYLGLGASAMCFVLWNKAVQLLGAMKTSAYIYLTPAITIVASVYFLKEKLTAATVIGTGLILAGLILSEKK